MCESEALRWRYTVLGRLPLKSSVLLLQESYWSGDQALTNCTHRPNTGACYIV